MYRLREREPSKHGKSGKNMLEGGEQLAEAVEAAVDAGGVRLFLCMAGYFEYTDHMLVYAYLWSRTWRS